MADMAGYSGTSGRTREGLRSRPYERRRFCFSALNSSKLKPLLIRKLISAKLAPLKQRRNKLIEGAFAKNYWLIAPKQKRLLAYGLLCSPSLVWPEAPLYPAMSATQLRRPLPSMACCPWVVGREQVCFPGSRDLGASVRVGEAGVCRKGMIM